MSKLWDWMDSFPPGRVPLLLLVLTIASAAAVAARSAATQEPVATIWTFTHLSAQEFERRLPAHPDGDRIKLHNLGRAICDRLSLAIMTDTGLPDLVEIEQSELGRFLRGPMENLPFVDLTDRVRSEGWDSKCVEARFAKYSLNGRIFGIPHDLHPVVLVYQPDRLKELGYKPEDLTTWADWVAAAGTLSQPGQQGAEDWRYGLALSTVECFDFLMLLWQRGGDVFDAQGKVTLDSELAIETLEFYVSLLKADPPLAGSQLSGWSEDFAALSRGQFVALLAPDWMLATMQLDAGSLLSGSVRCMPLPAWEPGGRRTSTSGGAMMGIPRGCPDVERAWELIKFLYLDQDALVERFRELTIVPPLRSAFDDPAFDQESDFFSGQRVGRLLTTLAEQVPPVQGSAYSPEAYALLNAVFADVIKGQVSPRDALTGVARGLREAIERDRLAVEAAGCK